MSGCQTGVESLPLRCLLSKLNPESETRPGMSPQKRPNQELDPILRPRAIAVIGASTGTHALGRQILENLVNYGFRGRVYPVNPKANELLGLRCFPSVLDVPEAVDLAVVVVPRERALAVAEECGRKGVRGVVVITAGFRETGGAGAEMEAELARQARQYGFFLEEIDINPFFASERAEDCKAADARMGLRADH